MSGIQITSILKRIKFNAGKRSNFEQPEIEQILADAWDKAACINDVLWRSNPDDPNARMAFMQACQPTGMGYFFEFCSFVPGHHSDAVEMNFSSKQVTIESIAPAPATNGTRREFATAIQVLALGHVLIMEHSQGVGGAASLRAYLTHLIRRVTNDPAHPVAHLTDAASPDWRRAIAHGGGIVEFIVPMDDLADAGVPDHLRALLSDIGRSIRGTKRVTTAFKAAESLNADDVLDAYENLSGDEIGCKVRLKNGDMLTPAKHRMQQTVRLPPRSSRSRPAVRTALGNYMMDLQGIDNGDAVLTLNGRFAPPRLATE
jgi:hypothetical protein